MNATLVIPGGRYDHQERHHRRVEDAGRDRERPRLIGGDERRHHDRLREQVQDADADDRLARLPAFLEIWVLVGRDGVVGGPDAHVADQAEEPELADQHLEERPLGDREAEPVAARLELRDVGIVGRVVDELVMGQVLEPIVMRRAVDREHAQIIGDEVVREPVLEEDVMRRLMRQPRELMLAGADEDDGHDRNRDVPGPGKAPAGPHLAEGDGETDDDGEVEPGADQPVEVRDVVGLADLLELFLDARVGEGVDGRFRERGGRRSCGSPGG